MARPRALAELVRAQTAAAMVLTVIVVGIGAALAMAFGPAAVALYCVGLPVPLTLLWLATDVVRADEQRDRVRPG